MTKLIKFPLIASWMDQPSHDAWIEDRNEGGIDEAASPQGVVLLDLEPKTVEALHALALTDYLELMEPEEQVSGTWITKGWTPALPGPAAFGYQEWMFVSNEDKDDILVYVVAREATILGGAS